MAYPSGVENIASYLLYKALFVGCINADGKTAPSYNVFFARSRSSLAQWHDVGNLTCKGDVPPAKSSSPYGKDWRVTSNIESEELENADPQYGRDFGERTEMYHF